MPLLLEREVVMSNCNSCKYNREKKCGQSEFMTDKEKEEYYEKKFAGCPWYETPGWESHYRWRL